MLGDLRRGCGDPLARGQDDGAGLGARVGSGPGLRPAGAAGDRGAVAGADDVGHRVGFGFADSEAGAAGGSRSWRVGARAVQQHVAELMRQRPRGLRGVQSGRDADAADGPPGDAVSWCTLLALDRVAEPPGQPAQGVPQAIGRVTRRGGHRCADGDGPAAGLGNVPHVRDLDGIAPAPVFPFGAGVPAGPAAPWIRLAGGAGEDPDAGLAADDLAFGLAPVFIAFDQGRVRPLGQDEE